MSRSRRTPAPPPTLPTGAGGPLTRAAGRATSGGGAAGATAFIVEDDGLLLLLVEQAVRALGLSPSPAGADPPVRGCPPTGAVMPGSLPCAADAVLPGRRPSSSCARHAVVFVGLDRPGLCCARAGRELEACGDGELRVGYAARAVRLLGAHRAHGCCDVYLALSPGPAGAVFAHPPAGCAIERAGLTAREADVLLLLAAGCVTRTMAERLCISAATARSHCRSVLRKMGTADRRRLRELVGEAR